MKTIDEFLSYLRRLDVKLWNDGDQLRYSAPQGKLTPTLLQDLRERKSEILAFLQKANLASPFTIEPIRPIPRDIKPSLSFAQQRLWFLDQLEGGTATYNIPVVLQLTGLVQVTALEQSLTEIVRRHEALRTTFKVVNGSPVQVIAPASAITLPVVNLQTSPAFEQSSLVQQLASKEAQRPFDLANDPLLRVTLLQLQPEEHVLLLVMHHIVSDGWSMGIFIRELSSLYEAFALGEPSPLPELPIQYADFAHWQRQWLSGEVLQTQLDYWRQQLTGVPPLLELPTERPRPSEQTNRGCTQSFKLNADLTQKLKRLSQQSGVTLFMTLLTAFNILLSRYSGEKDIVVGTPIANRNRSEIETLIGFFVNTLVLRTNLQGNPSFSELLTQVRQVALDAYAHQDLPFEKLVEELQPERSLSYTPLFQVMFALQNAPIGQLELPGLTITPLQLENVTSKFDLSLSMEETDSGLRGLWEYNTDLFDAATITRISGHFPTLLDGIVANPEQHLTELPLLTERERHQLLVEWNNTQIEYPQDKCIHQLFEEQVERTPDAVAVVFEDQQLTYQELNGRANQLAHYLRTVGVGLDVLVGICVERSIEMVVGLLGVFKAGGVYVPLDPDYPQHRLAFMLEDAQVSVLLTQECLLGKLPLHTAQVICLDVEWGTIAQQSVTTPSGLAEAQNLACVFYTSGSTGMPKGVMVIHQGLVNYALAAIKDFELQRSDRILQLASISFDVFLEELLPTLLSGATVVLQNSKALVSTDLQQVIEKQQLTGLELTTAHWHEWVYELSISQQRPPKSLRFMIIGGEKVLPERFTTWQQFDIPLFHVYGLTETTITSTIYKSPQSHEDQKVWSKLPIGRPMANTQIYLLDQHLQPVPVGVPGEVYIGGAGLVRGYLNRPELTAERFIPNPFSNDQGARLYKTGDLARYLRDGNIEFLGRIDHQVKIRGFRIETGEIETVLSQHPAVQQSVVMVREDVPGSKRLVAYVATSANLTPSITELRSFLQEKLPEYMVPFVFVLLNALPVTPNGKVNRQALPAPDTARPELEEAFIAPRTSLEKQLANIWAEVLSIEQVGVQDNFFGLGGNSLLGTRLISCIRHTFQVDLPLRSLFFAPTVAGQATIIVQKQAEQIDSQEIAQILAEIKEVV